MSDIKAKIIFSIIYMACAAIFIYHLERPAQFDDFESIRFSSERIENPDTGEITLKFKIKEGE